MDLGPGRNACFEDSKIRAKEKWFRPSANRIAVSQACRLDLTNLPVKVKRFFDPEIKVFFSIKAFRLDK